MEQDDHYHIWRMSQTGTSWFCTQTWRGIGLKVWQVNQFASQGRGRGARGLGRGRTARPALVPGAEVPRTRLLPVS